MHRRVLRAFFLLLGVSLAARAAEIMVGGVVLDSQARPIAGASVEILRLPSAYAEARAALENKDPDPVSKAVSDERGRFLGGVPEAGMWRLRIHARGFLPQQLDALPVVEQAELPAVRLEPATPLRVRVTDAEGRAAAGARLRVVSPVEDVSRPWPGYVLWRPAPRFAITGRDGTAVIPAGDRELIVTAIADGFLETTFKDLDRNVVTLRLIRGCRRGFEVVNPRDQPAAGILVQADRWTVAMTNASGRAEVTTPCTGERPLYLLTPDGRRAREVLRPVSGASSAASFRLPPRAAKLTGRVLDAASRRPLAGALVWPADAPWAFTRTDLQGRYRVRAPATRGAPLAATAGGGSFALDELVLLGSSGIRSEDGSRQGPTLYLQPATTVSGVVTDEEGRPVEEAEVRISVRSGAALARSDARGAFRLRFSQAREPAELFATHRDFLFSRSLLGSLAMRGGRPVKIVLLRGARAFAKVVRQDGRPVGGAEGILSSWPDVEPAVKLRVLSDGRGLLTFTPVSPGKYDLLLRAAGQAPLHVPGVAVGASGEAQNLGVFRLEPGAALEGRVVDAGNRPIAAVSVSSHDPWFGLESEVLTGADGRFSLTSLRGDSQINLGFAKLGYAWKSLSVVEAPAREPLTIVLEPLQRIAGSIRDERGAPITEASLTLRTPEMKDMSSSVMVMPHFMHDAEGRFELQTDAPGKMTLTVAARSYLKKDVELEVPAEGGVENLEIVLPTAPAVVVGQVSGPDGEPILNADVSLSRKESEGTGRWAPPFQPVTDGGGRFRAEGLDEGVWSFFISQQGYVQASKDLEVQAGENRLDFRLERGLEIDGEVVDSFGKPVSGARLWLKAEGGWSYNGSFGASDDAGRFLLTGVEPGSHTLNVHSKGYVEASSLVPVTGSSIRGLRIVLERGGVLRGRILGLDPKHLAKAQINAHRPSGSSASSRADFRGEYEIRGLAPGEWSVMAHAAGRTVEAKASLPTDSAETVCDLEFPPSFTLTGRLLQGDPTTGTALSIRATSASRRSSANLDQKGEFRLEGLEPGTYKVEIVDHGGKVVGEQEIELAGDRYVEIERAESENP